MKILFLDLDGTIREPKSEGDFIQHPLDQKPIDGAIEAVRLWHNWGWLVIGVTNQKGVLLGFKSSVQMYDEQQETLRLFPEIDSIYACPDEGESCIMIGQYASADFYWMGESSPKFRKPDTGIIELFRDDFQDPKNALMVGDMVTDWECAKKAGIPFIPAETWRMIDGNWLNNLSAIHLPRS